ncbi:FecR domain-containing protein [Sphingobium sp. BHU LFT2]|uniref:FecR family protein n=1 Tax=Sphingobium sp. BHU LFT2 TaxID=2807634 RepID=UPI001BE9DF41|nr:FecR domain-containing protein [Sphingobium sp. BHU LFT2]MBT2245877.1 FecR domain-containing protein [Sphingobium sp. BHU LFT2]
MVEKAAYWAAQLATDEATQEDHDACEAWSREHPLHRLAMERMRGLDAQFDSTDDIGRETIDAVLERRSRKGRWFGGLTLGLVLIAGGGWMAAQSLTVRAWFPDYETARGEQRAVTLADGSGLTIDTDAALDFRASGTDRIVTLFRGQILARVAKDSARPFAVETHDGTATAHGTAFIVRMEADATIVTVIESSVRACLSVAGPEACVDLSPGDQVRMGQGKLARLGRVDPETAAIWAEGWLAADDQPVAGVLRELNRYRTQPLRFDEGELAGVRVSGSFPLANTDRALHGILRSTGLRVSRTADGELWVRAK